METSKKFYTVSTNSVSSDYSDRKKPRKNATDFSKYLTGRSYQLFRRGIRSPRTVLFYDRCLYFFCKFLDLNTEQLVARYAPYVKENGRNIPNIDGQIELQKLVEDYVLALQERCDKNEIKPSSVITRMSPVRLLFDMNDIILNWNKIGKLLPRGESAADDEAYTHAQIQKMLDHCDLRSKTVILFIASSGIRLGAIAEPENKKLYLRDRDITPLYDPNDPKKLLCAHVKVYARTDAQYDTFVTPEAYRCYEEYKKLRIKYGEKMNEDSAAFVIRFDDKTYTDKSSSKPMDYYSIQRIINTIRKKAGVAIPSKNYNNRYTIKVVHGLRKFFLSSLKSVKTADGQYAIEFTNRERLMGHSLVKERSLEDSYDRLDQVKILLTEYLRAVHVLTISDEARLTLKVDRLEKDVSDYKTLDVEISQKDREIRDLKAQMDAMQESQREIAELLKDPTKLAELLKGDASD